MTARLSPVALLVAGAFFMENLDGTVIATALPQMAQSFQATPPALAIGMTAYLLTLAVFIPASGWAADRFGARRVFMAAMALFTAASVLCGLSQGRWEFTAARILQGGGGALMVPVGRLVVLRGTAKPDLMRAFATLTWPALVAPVLGPPVGGFIATYASWRWIFFLNVPLGLAGLAAAFYLIRGTGDHEPRPFDVRGFALNGPGTPWPVAGLLLALAGASRSLQFTSLNTLAFAEVPTALTGAANTLFNTAFQAAIGMGIALGAVLLHAAQAAGPAVGLHGPVAPFRAAFLSAAALALVPVPSFLALRRDAGSVVSGHCPRRSSA